MKRNKWYSEHSPNTNWTVNIYGVHLLKNYIVLYFYLDKVIFYAYSATNPWINPLIEIVVGQIEGNWSWQFRIMGGNNNE